MKQLNITSFLIVLLSMTGINASAHDIAVNNADGVTIYYKYINNNTELSVTYRGTYSYEYSNEYKGNVVIPESVNYKSKIYSVTSIGKGAFYYCSGLTSITIPNSVTSIGENAFSGCSGLTSVIIPESVTSIGERAFERCSGLTSITIPNSVTSIGEYAFSWSALTSITIPNSVTSIEKSAFSACTSLTSVTIGNSVKSIGNSAFSGCSGLTSVTIPNSVTSIGKNAFDGCSSLTSVTIPNSVTSIGIQTFWNCSGLTYITIPNSVTSIGGSAFSGCSGLTSVTIPNSVTSIGSGAFDGCKGLTKVIVSDIAAWCSISFNNYLSNPLCYAKHLYSDENTEITLLNIPNGVTSIGRYAFGDCSGLTSVTIGNSVTSIGESAFEHCSGLTSVDIPNSVTSIGGYAFSGCSGLTSINIPNSVTSIGAGAFSSCSGFTSATIPNSVTSIGEWAFSGCSGLTSVTIDSNNVLSKTFTVSRNLSNIFGSQVNTYIIGNNVTRIGAWAFSYCSALTSVTIPNSVKNIESHAFRGCYGLNSIIIPESVTSVGEYAFDGCSGLTSVTIPTSVTSIGEYAFSGCSGLTSIDIPNSVTSIGAGAFSDCSGLTSLIIPKGVTSIRNYAFTGCNNLREVYALTEYPAYVKIGSDAFPKSETNFRSTLYVKKGLKDLFSKSDGWKNFVDTREMTDEKYNELMEEASKKQGGEQEETTISMTVNLSSAGYATFYNDRYNFKLPTGVSALVLTSESGQTLNYKTIASGDANGIIPKGVAVIIVSNNRKGGTYTLTSTTESASYSGTNLLHGSSLQTMTSNVNGVSTSGNSNYVYYKLAYGRSGSASASKLGWYWGANNGAAFSIAGGKAWLALPKTSAQSLCDVLFIDDDATSIEGVEQSEMKGAIDAQYNMAGQRVGNGYNGIIIVNGKKVIR